MTAFEAWPKIPRAENLRIVLTEKLDGTNAQLLLTGESFLAGSRSRWLSTEADNFGFHAWATAHQEELLKTLGPGRFYGEWYGKGIQRGYGLQDKHLALFDTRLPVNPDIGLRTVPHLYDGKLDVGIIDEWTQRLRESSVAHPGQKAEGMVIHYLDFDKRVKVILDKP